MGISLAILFGFGLCAATIVAGRSVVLYALLFILVFFQEVGVGFTSDTGSFVFSQDFLNFYNFKFIEIVLAIVYPFIIFTNKDSSLSILRLEKRLCLIFFGWVAFLCALELYGHRSITVADWRLAVSGVMLFHMLSIFLNTEKKVLTFAKVLVVLLSMKALAGLALFWAGFGVHSPRGMVPFFWDTRQVDAFVLGIIILAAYLVNFRFIPIHARLLPRPLVYLMLLILMLTVLLSIRRTEWVMAFGGVVMIFMFSKAASVKHKVILALASFIGLFAVLALPGADNFRQHIGQYIQSMNLFSVEGSSDWQNQVHVDNVVQYARIISEEPVILLFGFRGREGTDYMSFEGGEWGLGVAHNSILRPIQNYGFVGLLVYLILFIKPFMRYRQVGRLSHIASTKFLAIGSLVFLFVLFIPSLVFVPPFYTSVKGLFFTFIAVYFLRASIYYSSQPGESSVKHKSVQHNKKATNSRILHSVTSAGTEG